MQSYKGDKRDIVFFVDYEYVDPDIAHEVEWSGAKKGPVTVGPGESATSKACIVFTDSDYSSRQGACDSATYDYDKQDALEDESETDQQEDDD